MNTTTHTSFLYTPMQVADILQVQRRTVYMWIKQKKLPAVRAGKRVRIHKDEVNRFLEVIK